MAVRAKMHLWGKERRARKGGEVERKWKCRRRKESGGQKPKIIGRVSKHGGFVEAKKRGLKGDHDVLICQAVEFSSVDT